METTVHDPDSGTPGKLQFGHGALRHGNFRQDPRSPRKSAKDLFKAAVVPLSVLAPILIGGEPADTWQYEHTCRVKVQMAAVTRTRPAFKAGWSATVELQVLLPQYVSHALLHEVIVDAGKLIGLADFRPTYGRFRVTQFAE